MSERAQKSPGQIRNELIIELATILHDLAPPAGQRIIGRKVDELHAAILREEHDRTQGQRP